MQQSHGYEMITDINTGRQIAVERSTGEVFETYNPTVPMGTIFYTPEQQRAYKERKEAERQAGIRIKRYGVKKEQFAFVSTASDFTDVSPANITRLIYLSTYLSWHDNELRKGERHRIKRCELSNILCVSNSTAERFWQEVSPRYVTEDDNGTLILNPNVFAKGSAKRLLAFYIKVFAKGMQALYKSVPKAQHKQLGYIFAMLPYVNTEHNILCHNTDERSIDNIEPMTMREFCEEIDFNYRHVNRLHSIFKHLRFDVDGRRELFCSIIRNEYTGKELMVVNPKVFYSGSNADSVAEFGVFY